MKVTKDYPTEPGFYWYRGVGPGPNPTKGPWGICYIGEIEIKHKYDRIKAGEWSDTPIPYPKENDN